MNDLFDPQINSTLGAEHLHLLLDKVDGQLPLALAAYNAGIAAASRWLPARSIAPDVWVENIPYNETRTYVQRILWHTVVYGWLRSDGQAQDTPSGSPRSAPAPPRRAWIELISPWGAPEYSSRGPRRAAPRTPPGCGSRPRNHPCQPGPLPRRN